MSNKEECYIHKTHLAIKKAIKYSHDKSLKDKRTMVTELELQFQLLSGDEAPQGKSDSLVLPLGLFSVAELYVTPLFLILKK